MELEILWYKCDNDYCLRYGTPTDVLPGESVECSECGSMMAAIYDPPPDVI